MRRGCDKKDPLLLEVDDVNARTQALSLALQVGKKGFEIGTPSFLTSWFSTIFVRLEDENWGSRFPTIMRDLYSGAVPSTKAENALREIEGIRNALSALPPDRVVWDFENRAAAPPWGTVISPLVTSLADYFVTSDGKDLMTVLSAAFTESARTSQGVSIG